jgi:hypothetical protein
MPPQQDDSRDRQIEALRRYVAELGLPRERSAGEPATAPAPPQRPPATVPWLLLTVVLVTIALVGGFLIGQARGNARQASRAEAGATSTTLGGTVSTPECKTAVDRANTSLAIAVKVQGLLEGYTSIMNQLESGKISSAEAIRLGTPSEVVASIQTAKFDAALNDYKQVVDKCRSREP